MAFGKRIILFIAMNMLIMVTLSIVMSVLGVQPYITQYGIDYQSLMIFCLIWGFGGAFISLALSRIMAKWMTGVKLISPDSRDSDEQWLYSTVKRMSERAGLPKAPEVGVYPSDEINAFATGPTRSRALVAVSSGLLRRMRKEEIEGVLGHEVAHIANGDMVTMTLLQGVMNAFVMFFARIVAHFLSQSVKEEMAPWVRFGATIAFEILFGILAMFVIAAFSRYREYRADAGGAKLSGRGNMISALQALQRTYEPHEEANPSLATMKISSAGGGILSWLSTHPPLESRIQRLQKSA
jgi:heat shock protein HtpX